MTGSILTPEASKNQGAFLARNSVAVAPAFAHCTNRCTRRKVTVTARSTKQENRKMKKRSQDENTILKNTIPARGSSTHPEQMGGKEKKGRAEWLRITGSILTPKSSKNQGAYIFRLSAYEKKNIPVWLPRSCSNRFVAIGSVCSDSRFSFRSFWILLESAPSFCEIPATSREIFLTYLRNYFALTLEKKRKEATAI